MPRASAKVTIPVCLVVPHPLAAQYLMWLLGKEPKIRAIKLNSQPNLAAASNIAVFLVDCDGLPLPVGECLPRLRLRDRSARFVVLDEQLMDARRMLQLGIHGFLAYSEVSDALISAIHAVAQGKIWVRPELLQEYMHKSLVAHNGGFSHKSELTVRENEIMDLLKERMSNNEIASLLGIQDSTVKFHISNILSKLQLTNRRDLLNKQHAFDLWNRLLLYSTISQP